MVGRVEVLAQWCKAEATMTDFIVIAGSQSRTVLNSEELQSDQDCLEFPMYVGP
jgi:hypothetical protein